MAQLIKINMIKQIIFFGITILFLSQSIILHSQVDKSKTTIVEFPKDEDSDAIEAHPEDMKNVKIAILTEEEVEKKLDVLRNKSNLVKFNPIMDIGRGYLPITYERMIIPRKLSLGIGLGPTFRDYLAMADLGIIFPNYANSDLFFQGNLETMPFSLGLTYELDAKYYYKNLMNNGVDANFNGFFIGGGFNSRIMNYRYEITSNDDNDRTVINTFRLYTGYSATINSGNLMYYYEFNAGIGARNYKTELVYKDISTGGWPNINEVEVSKTFNFIVPAFILNVKYGIMF